jgi:hypothetical protein
MAATLLSLSLTMVACATPGSAGTSPTPSVSPPSWQEAVAPSDVAAIHLTPDQTRLTVDLNLPAGTAGHDCWRNLTGTVTDFDDTTAHIQITADLWSDLRCATTTVVQPVTVTLPSPLGSRLVNVNNSSLGGYIADPAGNATLRYCYEFRCTPPPPASCDAASVADAAKGAEVDPHARWTVRGCDGHWLVLDFAWTGGPACDNACPSMSVTTMRWFYRATDHGWRGITGTRDPGCRSVQAAEPEFPAALCEGLGRP